MTGLRVLISGAGIAGSTVAYWLVKAGATVTIVERAAVLRSSGQNVDVRGHGLKIIQRMGLEDEVRSKTTKEQGLRFVNEDNTVAAEFPVEAGQGFTSDVEIMRGDLAKILYEATKEKVDYVFGEYIAGLEERSDGKGVDVKFANERQSQSFDIIIAADGWSSTTRKMVFGDGENKNGIKSLGQWTSWFTIPKKDTDPTWARWYNATKGRMILVRPDNEKVTRVSLWKITLGGEDDEFETTLKEGVDAQKKMMQRIFADAGWEAPRILEGMEEADDFYMQKVAQLKLDQWSKGRTVLVGDSGYCPSPISGMGTTVALVGAYVLAGEITKSPRDHETAFRNYEEKMRGFVATAQKLAPGAPAMANPQTQLGIYILYKFLGFVSWSGLNKLMGSSVNPPASAMDLPDYEL